MKQASAGRVTCGRPPARLLVSAILFAVAGLFVIRPAFAQSAATNGVPLANADALCAVQTDEGFGPALDDAKPVVAICGGAGVLLGYANEFQTLSNQRMRSVLVDMRRGAERHVLLISLQDDGQPILEDISGQIAMSAGRGPLSGLEGVRLDVAGFAQDGFISVRGRSGEGQGEAKDSAINLAQQVARTRIAHGSRAPQK